MGEARMLCHICGIRPATHTCKLCGRAVCDEDFDAKLGVCNSCKHGRAIRKG
jgi:hypothetical protein